jgi:hypothetical protein
MMVMHPPQQGQGGSQSLGAGTSTGSGGGATASSARPVFYTWGYVGCCRLAREKRRRMFAARLRPRHRQRRGPAAQGGVVRHAQRQTEQADNRADRPLSLPIGEAEHGAQHQRRQDRQRRIRRLNTSCDTRLRCPRRDRLIGKPNRDAASLQWSGVCAATRLAPVLRFRPIRPQTLEIRSQRWRRPMTEPMPMRSSGPSCVNIRPNSIPTAIVSASVGRSDDLR